MIMNCEREQVIMTRLEEGYKNLLRIAELLAVVGLGYLPTANLHINKE
jgi:hypothetical protein